MTNAAARLADVVAVLESAYPPGTAESWDRVGLVVGDPREDVRRVFLAVDPVESVVDEAIEWGADLVIVHHPLFLRGVNSVAATDFKGRIAHRLIRAGCGLYAAHTNADVAVGGASDQIARLLGLTDVRPLIPASAPPLDKFVVFVPVESTVAVRDAMAQTGAGAIGEYTDCAWKVTGEGTFIPGVGASPVIGSPGLRAEVIEDRLEMIAPRGKRGAILRALRITHPYEEPAFDVFELAELDASIGLGRLATVSVPTTLGDLARNVAASLPATVQGVRVSGPLEADVKLVAICSGSGDSFFEQVRASGADAFITADLRHHPASEAREAAQGGTPYLVDVSHFSSEWPWLLDAKGVLEAGTGRGELPELEIRISTKSTDPWTALIPSTP